MHRLVATAFVAFVVVLPSVGLAAENVEDDSSEDVRPVQYASIELNPLAPTVHRWGGQVQVALMGPLTLVGSASRIDAESVSGWAIEVGTRLFFGLEPRRTDGSRLAYVWLAATYLGDDLHVGGRDGERRGVAADAGVHARLGAGFYALGGVGVAHRTTNLPIRDRFEQMTTTPRLLLSLGWGL